MKDENDENNDTENESDAFGGKERPRNKRHVVEYDVGQRGVLFHVGHAIMHDREHERGPQARGEQVDDRKERLAFLAALRSYRRLLSSSSYAATTTPSTRHTRTDVVVMMMVMIIIIMTR